MRNALGRGLTAPRASNVVSILSGVGREKKAAKIVRLSDLGTKTPLPWTDVFYGYKFEVVIDSPLSMNNIYATGPSGVRFMTADHIDKKTGREVKGGKEYAGYEKKSKKGGVTFKTFIPGRLHDCFIDAGLPAFPLGSKVVVEATAEWPDQKARDMSNLQKPIEDALQKGGFVKNDRWILYRNQDFTFGERNELRLTVYAMRPDGTGERN